VVKPDRHTAWKKEYRNAVAVHQSSRIVHLKPPSSGQFHGEWPEWRSRNQRIEPLLKVFRGHIRIMHVKCCVANPAPIVAPHPFFT
jgi:hypothetical protein